jgi:hypothetical protein
VAPASLSKSDGHLVAVKWLRRMDIPQIHATTDLGTSLHCACDTSMWPELRIGVHKPTSHSRSGQNKPKPLATKLSARTTMECSVPAEYRLSRINLAFHVQLAPPLGITNDFSIAWQCPMSCGRY